MGDVIEPARWSRSSPASGSSPSAGAAAAPARRSRSSANTDLDRLFWAYGFRGRPARALVEVLGDLIDGSSVGGGVFDLGSATLRHDAGAHRPARRLRRARPALVEEVPGLRAEFERVGGGAVAQQLALRPGRRRAVRARRPARSSPTPPGGRSRPPAARLGPASSRSPARGRFADLHDDAHRRRRAGHGAPRVRRLSWPRLNPDKEGSFDVLQPVAMAHKSLADYTHIVGRPLVEEIRELAEPLQGQARRPPVARPRSAAACRRSSTRSSR